MMNVEKSFLYYMRTLKEEMMEGPEENVMDHLIGLVGDFIRYKSVAPRFHILSLLCILVKHSIISYIDFFDALENNSSSIQGLEEEIRKMSPADCFSLLTRFLGLFIGLCTPIHTIYDIEQINVIKMFVSSAIFENSADTEFHSLQQLYNMKLLKIHIMYADMIHSNSQDIQEQEEHRVLYSKLFSSHLFLLSSNGFFPILKDERKPFSSFVTKDGHQYGENKAKYLFSTFLLKQLLSFTSMDESYGNYNINSFFDCAFVKENLAEACMTRNHRWIKDFLGNLQDDQFINLLVLGCNVYHAFKGNRPEFSLLRLCISPHLLFYFFMEHVDFDHALIVEWLMNGDTNVLEYLLLYIQIFHNNLWEASECWAAYLHEDEEKMEQNEKALLKMEIGGLINERVIHFFISLSNMIELLWQQNEFPYNPAPLLRFLRKLPGSSKS